MSVVGRARETARLTALLDDLHESSGGALLVSGAPGSGKTTLLQLASEQARARGLRVLTVRGTPVEQHLAYAGLHLLLNSVLRDALPGLAPGHRQAVRHAFGMLEGRRSPPPEPFVVALGVLETLAELAGRTPVVLIADDAQWLDEAPLDVLAFVARRLGDQAVLLLLGSRLAQPASVEHLPLGPLPAREAQALITAHVPGLDAERVQQVLRAAEGNPLALVELSRVVSTGELQLIRDGASLAERVQTVFAGHVGVLPAGERTLLLALALEDGGSLRPASAVSGAPPELTVAVRAGLVTVEHDVVRFRHPLIRAAVEETADPAERRRLHEGWARLLDDSDRQAWHRFRSIDGPSEAVAGSLESAAESAQARGAPAAALAWWERAAAVSGDPRRRQRRRLSAGELAYQLGLTADLRRILGELHTEVVHPDEIDRLAWLEGVLDTGGATDAEGALGLVAGAARAVEQGRADLAALLLVTAARRCWWGDLEALRKPLLEVTARLGVPADDPRRLFVAAHADPIGSAENLLAGLREWAARPVRDPDAAAMLARTAFNLGDHERVLVFADRAAGVLRAQGRLSALAQVQVVNGWAAFFTGRWDTAHAAAAEAFERGQETHQPVLSAHARLGQATFAGFLGDRDRALATVLDAERIALMTGASTALSGVAFTRGSIALAGQRPSEAFEHFRQMMTPGDRAYHPVERLWLVDYYAEAAAGSGAVDEARSVVEELTPLVERAPSPGYVRALRLAQLWLADDSEADERVSAARAVASPSVPWYRARVDLAQGMLLRRRRQSVESRRPLQDALTVFETLGARAWAERARAELAASGLRAARTEQHGWTGLSAQELQIAQLAAQGMTNREIGARLFLSHRTVGSHLYRIYPKVGVRSRRELHRIFPRP